MAQPDLDFMAPEVQLEQGKEVLTVVDMFSLGMTICAIYNNGKSLIQANHNPSHYAKRVEQVSSAYCCNAVASMDSFSSSIRVSESCWNGWRDIIRKC